MGAGCPCCGWWGGAAGGSLEAAERLARIAPHMAAGNAAGEKTILRLQAAEAALADDNRRPAGADRSPSAEKNKIRSVPATDRRAPAGRAGRAEPHPP